MFTDSTKVIMGTISCIAPTTMNKDARITMHRRQLDWLESITQKMVEEKGETPIPYFRVEQGWEPETEEILKTSLPLTSLKYDKPIPPGAARNVLLDKLYDSNADWLICMDDDHGLYDHFNDYQLLWELGEEPAMKALYNNLVIVTSFPSYWDGYNKIVEAFGKKDTHWLFKPTKHPGCMPFCCIPNIYKIKGKKLYFDAETACNNVDTGDVPEDLKFQIDWLKSGGRIYEGMLFIGKSLGRMTDSSIYGDELSRRENLQDIRKKWVNSYLRTVFPRNPNIWTLSKLYARRNTSEDIVIKRKEW